MAKNNNSNKGGGNSGNSNKGAVGGKGSSSGSKGKASAGYAPKNSGGSNQTGWGGNAGSLYDELHAFNTGTWNPGSENPVVQPFLTQEDIEKYAEAREQYEEGLKTLDRNYETQKHSNEYEETEIEKGRIVGRDNENWDAAGRGLFRSSIRDGDLADIDAAAEIKKKFLSDSLSALAVYNEGQKTAQDAKWGRFEEAMNRKKVENAEGVSATMPKWQVEPSFTAGAPPSAPKPPKSQQPAPKPKFPNGATGPTGNAPKSTNGGTQAPTKPRGENISGTGKHNNGGTTAYSIAAMGSLYGKK